MNPDQTPTPETDEHEHFVASFSPKYWDRLTKERDDAPSPAETVQKDWDAMNGFTDEAKARAMFNLALSLEGDLNAMIRDADAYKEQLSKCEAHAGAMAKEYDAQVDSLRALVIAKREEN